MTKSLLSKLAALWTPQNKKLAFYIPVNKEYVKFECFLNKVSTVCVISYLDYVYEFTYTLTYLLMNMLGRWDDGGGVMAVKPETTVQDVSTLVIIKPLDVKTTIMNWMCKTSYV